MECNKDEAARAKEIAERKFSERNYISAKKFALKAQTLYSALEGLPQMLTTLEVYISAEHKVSGEADWYGILGVNPVDDDDTIRKQYRKLALMLHPDKNKSIGAEGAFKLVSEAWSLLSDKAKRLAYNQKRNLRGFQQKFPTKAEGQSAAPNSNGFQQFTNNGTSNVRTQQINTRPGFATAPSVKKADTFWTICNRCKTHYEYLRIYLNHTLLCPNCHEAFMAIERDPPATAFKQSNWPSRQSHQRKSHSSTSNNQFSSGEKFSGAQDAAAGVSSTANSVNRTNFQWSSFSRTSGDHNTIPTSSATLQAASVVQQASEKVKREREERQSAAEWERSHLFKGTGNPSSQVDRPVKRRNVENNYLNGYRGYVANEMAMGNGGAGAGSVFEFRKGNSETNRFYGTSGNYFMPNSVRELSYPELKIMLMDKARSTIRRKLEEWRLLSSKGRVGKEKEREKDKANKKQKRVVKGEKENPRNSKSSSIDMKSVADDKDQEVEVSPMSINVPDPDFHNFDLDRTEHSFGDEQVWAAYDNDDGMPRFYARVHKVISLKPFKMRISWLNSRSNSELGPIDWIGSGFTKTCGDFRTGRHETTGTLNAFSHKVSWAKGMRGVIRIYPEKGQVWAVYKNWSPEWNEQTPDEAIHKYEMVEVVDNFNEEQGVSVATLIKVDGFRTVFRMRSDAKEVRRIPKEELFRFSHQVPYYLLTGEEAHNAPKGCCELDPAATPLELIQVTAEANEAAAKENGGKVAADQMPQSSPSREADEVMEIASKAEEKEVTENGKLFKDDDDR